MSRKEHYKNINSKKKRKKEQEERLKKQKQEKLTHKQELFCQYYLKNFNATLAYVKAYGCDYDSALASGPRMLGNVRIKKEIERLKNLKKQSIMLDKDDIVERRMKIAFSDMADFADWGTIEQHITDKKGNPIYIENENGEKEYIKAKVNRVEFKNSNLVDGGLISEIKQGKDGATIKLEDRQKALSWLSEYFLMNPMDKHKIDFDNKKFNQDKQVHADRMTLEIEKLERGIGTDDEAPTKIVFTDNDVPEVKDDN